MNNKKTTTQKAIKIMLYVVMIIIFTLNVSYAQTTTQQEEDKWKRTKLLPDDLQDSLLEGIKSLHSFDFDNAEKHFKKAIKISPDRAFGYVYLAALNWVKLYEDNLNSEAEPELQKYLAEALKVGRRALSKDFANSYDYLFYAVAKVLSVRTQFKNNNYPMAFLDFLDAIKYLKKANDIEVEKQSKLGNRTTVASNENVEELNFDVKFGLGLYQAYIGSLPKYLLEMLKQVTKFETNVKEGINNILNVSNYGTLFKIEATLLMVNIDGLYNNNYTNGMNYAKKINKAFPLNMINNFMIIDMNSKHGKYEEAINSSKKAQDDVAKSSFSKERKKIWGAKINYYVGNIYFSNKEYEKAKKIYTDILVECNKRIKEDPTLQITSDPNALGSFFRLGLLYDLEGKREKAISCYGECLKSNLVSTIKDYAQMFIDKPYTEDDKRINSKYYQEYYIP